MTDKKIQEQFGLMFIDATAELAENNINSTAELGNDEFLYVRD